MAELDWHSFTPVVAADYTRGYFTLPAFELEAPEWKGASEIARQYNYSASKNFALRRRPEKPSGVTYGLCIRYRQGDIVTRYKLWNDAAFKLDGVPLYTGQIIKQNFCLEVWSFEGEEDISQESDLTLRTGIRRVVTDFSAIPSDFVDSDGEAVASLESASGLPASPPLDGLAGWYRAANYESVSGGVWTDSSGNGRDLSQVNPALQPDLVVDAFGNIAAAQVVRFDGVNDVLSVNGAVEARHVFIALRQKGWVDNAIIFRSNDESIIQDGVSAGLSAISDVTTHGPTAAALNTDYLLEFIHSPAATEFKLHTLLGQNIASLGPGAFGGGGTTWELGSAQVDIAEVLLYGAVLSDENVAILKAYIAGIHHTQVMALPISFDSGSAWLDNT